MFIGWWVAAIRIGFRTLEDIDNKYLREIVEKELCSQNDQRMNEHVRTAYWIP